MGANTLRRIGAVAAAVVIATTLTAVPAAADPHHQLFGEALLQSCVTELNANRLPVDKHIAAPPASTRVPSYNNPDESGCWNLGWTEFTVPIGTRFTVTPRFGGPNINSSGWDCNHSSVTFGFYQWQDLPGTLPDQWAYVAGGVMHGGLSGGTCVYDVSNPPSQASWGQNSVTTVSGWLPYRFRVATLSWAHNDPGLGHPGALCAGESCVWHTHLTTTVA